MKNSTHTSRRKAIQTMIAASGTIAGLSLSTRIEAAEAALSVELKGKVNHSVCRWCYQDIPLEDLCKAAKKIGLASIELVGPEEWEAAIIEDELSLVKDVEGADFSNFRPDRNAAAGGALPKVHGTTR